MHGFVVADVREMLPDGGRDIDLPHADAEFFAKFDRVGFCPLRRAEARHGDAQNFFPAAPGQIERAHAHQQCQCAVQSAGNTDYSCFSFGMNQSLCQAGYLDREYFFTMLIQFCSLGDKRM